MLPPILAERRWRLLVLLAATGLLQSFCMLALINWARLYIEGQHILSVSGGLLIVVTILLLAGGRYIERYKAEQMAQGYIYTLRKLIFTKAQSLPAKDLRVAGKGATLLRLTGDLGAVRNWIVQGLAPLIVIGIWSLVSILALLQLHWGLAVAVLVPLALACSGNFVLGRLLFRRSEKLRRLRSKMIRNVTEKLRHLHLIRAFNQTGRENRQFLGRARKLRRSQLRRAHISALMRGMNEALLLVTVLTLVSSALWLNQQGQLSGELMAVLMTAALYLLNQLRRLTRLYEYWTLYRVAEKKLGQFVNRPSFRQGRRKRLSDSFSMSLDRVRVQGRLSRQSFSISNRSRILLSGSSGCGKSTLLALIAGHITPDGGRIKLCGRKLSSYSTGFISQQICLVSQLFPLLRGTLEENIYYGGRHLNEAYVSRVLDICQLNEAEGLTNGLATRITEDGLNLSVSLRYRVMLARALMRQPALLLLDEDAAMGSVEIRKVIQNISRFYPGAMVVCGTETDYAGFSDEVWMISRRQKRSGSEDGNKVIRLETYAKSE